MRPNLAGPAFGTGQTSRWERAWDRSCPGHPNASKATNQIKLGPKLTKKMARDWTLNCKALFPALMTGLLTFGLVDKGVREPPGLVVPFEDGL